VEREKRLRAATPNVRTVLPLDAMEVMNGSLRLDGRWERMSPAAPIAPPFRRETLRGAATRPGRRVESADGVLRAQRDHEGRTR
jgi:hypothetical protein